MGKIISKIVFSPPKKSTIVDMESDVFLETKHKTLIQVRTVERKSKLYLLISHSNAEDLFSVSYWVNSILLQYVNVNVVIYGKIICII